MDDPEAPREELSHAFRYLRHLNRFLGGRQALLSRLRRWSAGWSKGERISLLDVATGSADLPRAACVWARKQGYQLSVTAIDKHATTLDLAREHTKDFSEISLLRVDALHLDRCFRPGSFDYVHAGLFLHHLSDDDAVNVLRSMAAIARRGVIWNDLVRSRAAYTVIRVLTAGSTNMLRHDARVSVLAGFTREEALELAARAGLTFASYEWNVWTHRFTIAGEKPMDDAARRLLKN